MRGEPDNTSDYNAVTADYGIDVWLLHNYGIPRFIVEWFMFDAPTSVDVVSMLEYKRHTGDSWTEVFTILKHEGHKIHRMDYGGVHPGLDPPRRVW